MSDLTTVETSILEINEWTTPEDLGALKDRLTFFAGKIKEMRAMLDAKMLEIIQETGQDIEIGPVRYYAGIDKEKKCKDYKAALVALLDKSGGDMDAVVGCIASGGLKPGACKSILGDDFDKYFETVEKDVIKDGKPTKKLLSTNENFTKRN